MINLLIVTDNKMFVQRIYEHLDKIDHLLINATFSSSRIFEAYLIYKPNVIILDCDLLLPISSIVSHFSSYNWNCKFIVVGNEGQTMPLVPPEVICAYSNKESLLRALHNISATLISKEITSVVLPIMEESFEPDIYYLMLSVKTNRLTEKTDKDKIQSLKKQITTVGEAEVFSVLDDKILILMKKSRMRMTDGFRYIHTLICREIDGSYASIYCDKLKPEDLDSTCQCLMDCSPLGFLFTSSCLHLKDIYKTKAKKLDNDIYQFILNFLQALLLGKHSSAQEILRNLYFLIIKRNLDLESLEQTRSWLQFWDYVLFSFISKKRFTLECIPCSIEEEYRYTITYWDYVGQKLQNISLLPAARDCLILLMRNYSNPKLSLEQTAKTLGFSKGYISRVFRKQFGITFMDMVLKLRMEVATGLLKYTISPVKTIASQVGYTDAQYFSRMFHRSFGLSPTSYRSAYQKEVPNACICEK